MTNSKTSDHSKRMQEIKDRFALIAGIANRATYEQVPPEDALSDINGIWDELEVLIYDGPQLTRPSNGPHYYNGMKW